VSRTGAASVTPDQIRRHKAETGHFLGDQPATCDLCARSDEDVNAARRERRRRARRMDAAVTRTLDWARSS
jgi:hypothetical protein